MPENENTPVSDPPLLAQGWGWPANARKAHYFAAGETIAICGRWMYTGRRDDDHHDSPDNCSECGRKRTVT